MATTNVSTGSLQNVARNVSEQVVKYNKSVERIYEIGSELDAMWDGDANKKFMSVIGNDRERFSAMSKLLMQYIDALNQSAKIYSETENSVKEIMTTNKVR